MHARITTIEGQPDKVEQAIEKVKSEVVPVVQSQDGFKGFSVFVDRSSGKMIGLSYWESEEAMRASEEAVSGPREETAQATGAGTPQVERFEVVVDTEA